MTNSLKEVVRFDGPEVVQPGLEPVQPGLEPVPNQQHLNIVPAHGHVPHRERMGGLTRITFWMAVMMAALVVIVIAVAVGLGVGLGTKAHSTSIPSATIATSSDTTSTLLHILYSIINIHKYYLRNNFYILIVCINIHLNPVPNIHNHL
ncbi:hypothetical protein EYZ11_011701 [Aspergillus tanneri]|uniref:Uncharacterized protein n=1 Tax=Aspergillus tanneri TaxID=1220188 RepID=A0A4S3J243_9EURO|nr:hypothetical protein EYZ11_011701 [Aspergillus tanneri]